MNFDQMHLEIEDRFHELRPLKFFENFIQKFLKNPTGKEEGKLLELSPVNTISALKNIL